MEVSVENVEGIPDGSILSIRAGNVRRQGTLPTSKPVRFPTTGLLDACPFKVDVFSPLGSSRLVLKPKTERYAVTLNDTEDGLSDMSMNLVVRELGGEEDGAADKPPAAAESRQARKQKAMNETQAYIEEHEIVRFVQNLMASVLAEKPADPFAYMERHLACMRTGAQPGAAKKVPIPLVTPSRKMSLEMRQKSKQHFAAALLAHKAKDFEGPAFVREDCDGGLAACVPLAREHLMQPESEVLQLKIPSLSSQFPSRCSDSPMKGLIKSAQESNPYVTQTISFQGVQRCYNMCLAGATHQLHFNPKDVVATIVTCGGLCPGLNAVIREIVMTLYTYGAKKIWGIRGGYKGVIKPAEWLELTPESVHDIHNLGGTVLVSDRGNPTEEDQAKCLMEMGVRQHFIIGGDGTHLGAYDMYEMMKSLKYECSVVGVPKTIDNDIPLLDRTFGFDTACTEAKKAIDAAYVESTCNANCIGLVKLMGRLCGFIAQNACLAARNVDIVLLPEMEIALSKVLDHCLHLMQTKGHAVVVVAEGCGDTLIKSSGEKDAGGNMKLADVGPWLRDKITERFKEVKLPLTIKYIDPTYMIRAVQPNANDSVYCSVLAQNAVHAAMSGYTGVTSAQVQQQFVILPIQCVTKLPLKRVDLRGRWFMELRSTTLQPDLAPDGYEPPPPVKPDPDALKDCTEPCEGINFLPPSTEVRRLELEHLKDKFGPKDMQTPLTEKVRGGDLGFVDEDSWVSQTLRAGNVRLQMLKAGPRRSLHFWPEDVAATIVTCGGLCPGLNSVIRELVMMLYAYGVKKVYGIKGGYKGVTNPACWLTLTPENVQDIHKQGGSILVSDRGNPPHIEMAKMLQKKGVRQHFVLGGDGTQKGAYQTYEQMQAIGWECSVVGIPKTIDNDINLLDRSFGFDTAMTEAENAIDTAYVEATCNANSIGLVKLMGRHCGYLTMMASLAARHVDICLLPEMDISVEKVLDHCVHLLSQQGYAVVVCGEGCGDTLMKGTGEVDDGGNKKMSDVGPWLKDQITAHFKGLHLPVTIKYVDPTYMVRAVPANANDSIYCSVLAQAAVHAAMAGYTGITVGKVDSSVVYIPIKMITGMPSRVVDVNGAWFERLLATTGQPNLEETGASTAKPIDPTQAAARTPFSRGAKPRGTVRLTPAFSAETTEDQVRVPDANLKIINGYGNEVETRPIRREDILVTSDEIRELICFHLSERYGLFRIPSTLKNTQYCDSLSWTTQAMFLGDRVDSGKGNPYYKMIRAGAREHLHFDPYDPASCAAIVSCGGICPGLNSVIREVVMTLWAYGVRKIYGVKGGYKGVVEPESWIMLTPEVVKDIHLSGGTMLISDRGNPPHLDMAKVLQEKGVRQYFVLGGDGTHKGAMQTFDCCLEIDHECAVIGVPKTIDNDVPMFDQTFGFDTACTEAVKAVDSAYVEARCNANCIGLVKLMGRHCGFIAMNAALAARHVDICLIPEMEIDLEKVLEHTEALMQRQGHAVIVVAEGCGDTIITSSGAVDAGGNKVLADVGPWLKDTITKRFKDKGLPLSIKYIDPTYMIRSVPANSFDSAYCSALGQMAVHGAMAGYSGVTVGKVYERYVYLPIHAITMQKGKRVNPKGRWFNRMMETTKQPDFRPTCPSRPSTADGHKKPEDVLQALSIPGSINHLLQPGDEFRRMQVVNLAEKYPGAKVANPVHPASSKVFLSEDSWSTQTLMRFNKRDDRGHVYYQMLRSGPREILHFDPKHGSAVIVTCGGLCPGLNSVIREIVMTLANYGVQNIYGCIGGYKGMVLPEKWVKLTPEKVQNIHMQGGTILVSDRGNPPHMEIAKTLKKMNIRQYFVIGGDGTQTGAMDTFTCTQEIDHEVAVVGVPKTIDNDIPVLDRSFGFNTACSEAEKAIGCAYVEASGNTNCIGLVKLMGRHCGFIAMHATLAARSVDICLLPEMDISLPKVFTQAMKLMKKQGHAVIVVAEGCGDTLLKSSGERDAGGNKKLADVGPWLKEQLLGYFKKMQQPLTIKYIDPTYTIRAVPANANDSVYCSVLAQHAVHGAFAGYTGTIVGKVDERFVMLPMHAITMNNKRKVDLKSRPYERMLATTGQPDLSPGVGDDWLLLPKPPAEQPEEQEEVTCPPPISISDWKKLPEDAAGEDSEVPEAAFKACDGFGAEREERSLGRRDLVQEGAEVRRLQVISLGDKYPSRNVKSPFGKHLQGGDFLDGDSWAMEAMSSTGRLDSGKGRPYYQMLSAGPREYLHFNPQDPDFCAAIVTCGGLCPGENNVVRAIVRMLLTYGAKTIYGIQNGFQGFVSDKSWTSLTAELVQDIDFKGGTILKSDRGNPPHVQMAEALKRRNVRQLFILGGEGAHKGMMQLCSALVQVDHECACVGVPSTVDNDIAMVDVSFGFETACSEARKAIDAAYVEAKCNANCIGFVKLLGLHSGFLALKSTLASRHVDICLLTEMEMSLEKVLSHCETLMSSQGYAVMVVADGCGHSLFRDAGERPENGDVGPWLKDKILDRFKSKGKPLTIKYIDPTYMVRSVKANAYDSVYCSSLAEHAVHGAMSGLTCVTTAKIYECYCYLPVQVVCSMKKRVNCTGRWFGRMRFTTGQPAFEPDGFAYQPAEDDKELMKANSTLIPFTSLLTSGSKVTRLECVSLKDRFPSKDIDNPTMAYLGSECVKPQSWTTQCFQRAGQGDVAPRLYLQMQRSGPQQKIHFDPKEPGAAAAIVTCGGLCPGLNNVIREIVKMLHTYGVEKVYGIIGGFKGCVQDETWKELTEDYVQDIHMQGGSVLVSDRGNPPHSEIAKVLAKNNIRQYFVLGGDGTHKGAMQSFEAMTEIGHECAVVGVPKTIDNDILLLDRTFGFDTAVEWAREAISSAYVEATTNANCIGLVKLMGRHCGWIAATAALAAGHVDICLIPEMDISLPKLLDHVAEVLQRQKYMVIVVAEGCGDTIIQSSGGTDAGGNKVLADVGPYLKDQITSHCKANNVPLTIKYIDPTYMIRAVPANAFDSIYCSVLAQMAVHSAMAGYTGITVGKVDERFVSLPIHSIVDKGARKVSLTGFTYQRLVATTRQPSFAA